MIKYQSLEVIIYQIKSIVSERLVQDPYTAAVFFFFLVL